MKKFFKRMGDYNFWVSLSAGVVILLSALGNAFGFTIKNQIIQDCIMAVAGMLVVFGIVNMKDVDNDDENGKDDQDDNEISEE